MSETFGEKPPIEAPKDLAEQQVGEPNTHLPDPCEDCPIRVAYREINLQHYSVYDKTPAHQHEAYRRLGRADEVTLKMMSVGNLESRDKVYEIDSSECEGPEKKLQVGTDKNVFFGYSCRGKLVTRPASSPENHPELEQ